MDLFEKAGTIARAAADKTTEAVGDARLKVQIMNDEKSIRELEIKIGAHYYEKFVAGEAVDEEVIQYCTAISVHKENMKEKRAILNVEPTARKKEEEPFEQP